jgi:hypothetical protein
VPAVPVPVDFLQILTFSRACLRLGVLGMRVAYPLSKISKNPYGREDVPLNKQSSMKLIGSLMRR